MPKFKLKFVAHQEAEKIVEAKSFEDALKLADREISDYNSDMDTRCCGFDLKLIEEIES